MTIKPIIFALSAVTLAGCLDMPVLGTAADGNSTAPVAQSSVYNGLKIKSRRTMTVQVTGMTDACFDQSGKMYDCYTAVSTDGKIIKFDNGIDGYRFRDNEPETIVIEEIHYANPPADASSIRYVRVG